jgi:glycosyltransferase involved in cell wall biosynthesis
MSYVKYGLLCDKIVTVSNAIKDVLVQGGVDPSKVVCVHSIVDATCYDVARDENIRAELGIPADSSLIAIVAQLIERKGHSYLLRAMPAILEEHPNTMLLVLGRGSLAAKLKNQVDSLGIGDNVVFAGFRRDIPKLLHELDILVHPASMEGLGVAILQAMAAGVPVVATPVGGIPEAVKDGVNGYLVPPKDSDAIADAVIRLLADPELRARMGSSGRAIVEDLFCPERMVEGFLSVYRDVIDSKRRTDH